MFVKGEGRQALFVMNYKYICNINMKVGKWCNMVYI